MQRGVFSIDGLDLSVSSSGHGKPFVFQHGLCGAADQVVEIFPKTDEWQCITLECRGHGKSPCGDFASLSIKQFTLDIVDYIGSSDIGPVPIGGISMGAAIAMRLAVKHPDLVSGLVIARPAWIDQSGPDNLLANREVAQHLAKHGAKEARARFEQSPVAAQIRREAPDNLNSLLNFFERESITETQALLASIASDGPGVSLAEIAEIQVPALVIGTQKDMIHPMGMANRIAGLIPSARLVEITPKSDSLDNYRKEFRDALSQFMEELD